jgi:hypothetical protein
MRYLLMVLALMIVVSGCCSAGKKMCKMGCTKPCCAKHSMTTTTETSNDLTGTTETITTETTTTKTE